LSLVLKLTEFALEFQVKSTLGLSAPVFANSPEEAADHFGWLGRFAAIDCPASSERIRELLGWRLTGQPGLIADLEPLGTTT
jgi:hypothetical protein